MSEKKNRKITLPKGNVLEELTLRIKLILRLMADRRVNLLLKGLPIATLVYLVFPDLVPGPIDDVAVIWLGTYLFVELCPPEVVEEHMKALRQVVPGEWHDASVQPDNAYRNPEHGVSGEDDSIVDVEFWDKKEE